MGGIDHGGQESGPPPPIGLLFHSVQADGEDRTTGAGHHRLMEHVQQSPAHVKHPEPPQEIKPALEPRVTCATPRYLQLV